MKKKKHTQLSTKSKLRKKIRLLNYSLLYRILYLPLIAPVGVFGYIESIEKALMREELKMEGYSNEEIHEIIKEAY